MAYDASEKRAQMEQELKTLEEQIYMLESYYLEETMNTGNIIKGWEGYFTNKLVNKLQQVPQVKKPKVSANDRVFSLSSTTSPAVEENFERNKENAEGVPSYQRSKRNKKKMKYDKLQRPGANESPSRGYEQESSFINQDQYNETQAENSEEQQDETPEDIRKMGPSQIKKKKIKKVKKTKIFRQKQF